MSLKNASNRGNQKVPHGTGKKSYAVVRNEMQMENGEDPTDYDFWMATHVGFAKSTLDKKTSKFIGKLKQLVSRNPEALKNKDVKDQLLAKFLAPEKPGQMRKYGFGPTPNQINAIKNQKKIVDEKVSVLVDSIRKELKEEILSDLRAVIEEIVRDIIRSQTRKNSLAQESSEFLAPSVARQDIGVPEPNLVPESSNTPVNREDAHVESHAPSKSSSRPQVQETDARIQQSSANKDKLKKRKLYGSVRSIWKS
ncbi:PREDICTED: uncharacterized protein LOC105961742 [Erythranthe guttata]|uniref:uncharacterized protein LOC105961742 n=1 Tax=Erythranthe guttata TaxID=4155 RepID=UPI00064E0E54|nr:PREDICTED: uncharacterized protein LOC105961742 [Erythranthe guttata]XP_012841450.1 PREDICTED: uncharacterized protein LOC105961742 [Erythranthe guttata]XP_012841451.1 PREDICTED: uncharacterized protein LOC105961742 [Erythranthe guttata]|eukprot:XP_012841449.1 PREDICTED: uncharacterized protein LOC105961742 [Erythranthe guttata]